MVVTRIAPSPTGDPHVGTAYIALFNYAWARRNGGRFIVRIEDTDRARYVPGAEERILAALKWLGLSYDEGPDVGGPHGPYRQSERLPLYQKYAEELLKRGWAYRAFETPEELEQIRKEKGGYDGRARNIPPEEAEERARRGEPHVIRLKVPRPGTTEVKDELRGVVVYDNQEIPDVVLLKSDGYPTYHLANVVDDHLMGVTDVIRAEEWLVSTPIHVLLYRAFGWEAPRFYHMPLLRNPDKTKISKRKSHTSLDWYKAEGFLPEALRNYLCLMGFSMPDGREIFTLEEFIQAFTWERVSLGGPVFDLEKLRWMNGKYIREVLSLEEVAERVKPFLREAGLSWESEAYLRRAVELMRPRFDTLKEFPEKARYLFTEDYPVSEKAQRKLEEGLPLLKELYPRLRAQEEWTEAALEALLRGFAAEKGVKLGQVAQPLRAALTGSLETPGLFEILALLGKERALRRLERALA
ncbi:MULTISPECIES: glutamate--tRNA ligase [Thermus]|jgi:glutamyl-tRNA synthetase|uniref:Glutamate--tRNA ligase n=1 Tax=Thermus thermophilus (strain ATCC 27634 / DSM 579 / HB8) TaxID=300852 RepID=SYE_THET8|nr:MULTISPECIES: glutamate--tRNA ligase [Thermus]P27000.2 RecName: Full=Glutamate--tRNA ligase; AltName: Full=Glutamyl-tRNA synthetase; Short=GluRS [Thermus thermophilus HB8]1J09_A Chain A, Glutamyl-tRNA synthetase [Thermus thermophilus]1N75_A Chain A, Glutamyl-tRNA synthetase [Thermus thermophilus]1N77_A Chain A, Glutamyl-tRNA synthetase [Thermus thermophilus]1N77_B Chain B, Glutamyl-tRNA synthetase [Thermus thermophilus]1N78_A Chain A, Glutamyl-tRNA synthetase [Thermus thermophilus]1N78_B 